MEVEMAQGDPRDPAASEPGGPRHERSGRDIEDAMARAEEGTEVEGRHTLEETGPPGESRVEQMREVEEPTEGRVDQGEAQPPRPRPDEIGAGGAQRIEGPRISDRVAAGEPVPDGPPFDGERERPKEQNASDAGT
jgi:hypothetical protein